MPAITPALGASPSYMPCAASWPISRKGVPGSSSCSTRSRGSSLPRAVCLSRAAGPPPCSAFDAFALRSSTNVRIASALARNSADCGLTWVFRICMSRSLIPWVQVSLQGLQRRVIALFPRLSAADAHASAPQQSVGQVVDKPVHLDALAAVPGAPQDGGPADVRDLLHDVELDQSRGAVLVAVRLEPRFLLVRDVLDVAQP